MASPQPHRILRQVVELSGCRRDEAAALQAAAARICQRDWVPVIDRVCSAQVDARRVLRIARLQVDLGVVPASTWHAAAAQGPVPGTGAASAPAGHALTGQFEAVFAARLAAALRDAAEVQTDAELLAFFLQTGALPWWADVADRACIVRAAEAMAGQPPAVWRQWLATGGLPADDRPLRRLAAALPRALRQRLLAAWLAQPAAGAAAPADEGWTAEQQAAWQAAIERAAVALGRSPSAWDRAWWQAALAHALWPDADGVGWPALLRRWIDTLDAPAVQVRRALRRALDAPAATATAGAAARAPLWRALGSEPTQTAAADLEAGLRPVLAALANLAAGSRGDAVVWRHLLERLAGTGPHRAGGQTPRAADRFDPTSAAAQHVAGPPAIGRLPQAVRRHVVDAWARLQATAGAPAGASADAARSDMAAALQALLQVAVRQGLVDPVAAGLAGSNDRMAQCAAAWARALQPAGAVSSAPSALAGAEQLYVPNAGLVLLWPFIQRFADRLGLLRPGKPVRWRDAAAARRAAVLLHCAISGDPEPPEFQLLLPKLLCGLPLDEPLQPVEAPSTDEQAECEAMLVAVIAQAPILRQMSVAGFRASFGLREGQLSSRDGHPLLRVERQAYDVVIDRFPWSASLVRLPWMPTLLQVQW
ncbi:MAG: hypothetical protein JNL87_11275 [Burkholderiaceae bacterium]|nr:hypothetical protein [Burkholderiaceae bacterium]